MREIKFRLWCSNNKEWERGEWAITPIGTLVEMKFTRTIHISDKTHLLSQYTGLKDMNGKEIYEGDIIKVYTPFGDVQLTSYITYEEGMFLTEDTGSILGRINYRCEVIGNIYENPELLGD